MKKLLLALSLASSLSAATNAQIIEFFKKIPDFANANVQVISREKLADTNFDAVTVKLSNPQQSMEEIIFVNGDLIATELINVKTLRSYSNEFREKKEALQRAQFDKKALALLKDETMTINIGDKNKPVLYVFSDPQCPYCRKFLARINDELQKYQLKYVITSVHGEPGFKRVAMLYKAIKNAKTDEEKIAVLNKYYASDFKGGVSVDKEQIDAARSLFDKYNKIGLRAVPTIIDPSTIK